MAKRSTTPNTNGDSAPATRRRVVKPAIGEPTARLPRKSKAVAPARVAEDVLEAYAPTAEEIAVRAYHISLERGRPGDPFQDWLLAEQQLRSGQFRHP